MTNSVDAVVRILEVTCCGECPYLDARWSELPWGCNLSYDSEMVHDPEKIAEGCELDTKTDYLDANAEAQARSKAR